MTNKFPVIAVPTPEISKIVQEKLFELGYKWEDKSYNPHPTRCYDRRSYIGLWKENKKLVYNFRKSYLEDNKNDYYEITMYDLYQMEPMMPDSVKLFNEEGELVVELSRQSLENLKKL